GLAERNARDIAREGGNRKLLLVPVDVVVEAMIRCTKSEMPSEEWGNLLASRRGLLTRDDLPAVPQARAITERKDAQVLSGWHSADRALQGHSRGCCPRWQPARPRRFDVALR